LKKIKPKLQPTVDTDQLKKGLETENLALKQQILQLQSELEKRDQQIRPLQEQNRVLEDSLRSREAQLNLLDEKLKEYKSELSAKDKTIAHYKSLKSITTNTNESVQNLSKELEMTQQAILAHQEQNRFLDIQLTKLELDKQQLAHAYLKLNGELVYKMDKLSRDVRFLEIRNNIFTAQFGLRGVEVENLIQNLQQIQSLREELIFAKKSYFEKLVVALKLNYALKSITINIRWEELYEEVQRADLKQELWESWLYKRIEKL